MKKTSPKSRQFSLLVFIVILVSLSVGIYYSPRKKVDCEIITKNNISLYQNNIYNFSLTIPPTVRLAKGKCDKYPIISGYYQYDSLDTKFELGLIEKVPGVSLEELVERKNAQFASETRIIKQEQTKIAEQNAIHRIGKDKMGEYESYYIETDNVIIMMVKYNNIASKLPTDPIFDSIVQSFRHIK